VSGALQVCLAYSHSLAEREFQPDRFHENVGLVAYYTVLLMTAGGPSVSEIGSPCLGVCTHCDPIMCAGRAVTRSSVVGCCSRPAGWLGGGMLGGAAL
jgi:hypothetical protein